MALVSIDPKALEHACLCAGRSVHHFDRMGDDLPLRASIVAHARAIEREAATEARHAEEMREQAERFEAFRQEVSDAVEHCRACSDPEAWTRIKFELERFIIAKPDPLVEAIAAALREASPFADDGHDYTAEAKVAAAAVRAHQKDTNA